MEVHSMTQKRWLTVFTFAFVFLFITALSTTDAVSAEKLTREGVVEILKSSRNLEGADC